MALLLRPAPVTRAAGALVLVVAICLTAGCRRQDPYCERVRAAFDAIDDLRGDPQARTDPQEALTRLKGAFGQLRDGAPEEVHGDVDALLRYVDSLQSSQDVARDEPADVRTAGDHLADWMGRACED
jgi:hypothetical protein